MGIRIEFRDGQVHLIGHGSENLKYGEHELLTFLAEVIGGKTIEERRIMNERNTLAIDLKRE